MDNTPNSASASAVASGQVALARFTVDVLGKCYSTGVTTPWSRERERERERGRQRETEGERERDALGCREMTPMVMRGVAVSPQ